MEMVIVFAINENFSDSELKLNDLEQLVKKIGDLKAGVLKKKENNFK